MALLGFIGFLVPVVFLGLIVLVIAAVAGGRGEPDPTGRRLYAIYLTTVSFIALFSVLGTGFFLLHSFFEMVLIDATGGCPDELGTELCFNMLGSGSGSGGREVLQAALLVLASGAVLYLHGRKLLELAGDRPAADSPAGRVILTFGYATAFGLVFTILGSSTAALSALVDAVAPGGSFSSGDQATATVLSSAIFAGVSAWLFFYVWRTLDLGTTTRSTTGPPTPPAVPPPGL